MAAEESSETATSIASLMPANERHKGDWQQRLRADRPIGKLLYQHQLLDKKGGANRNDHAAARFELLEQGWWNRFCQHLRQVADTSRRGVRCCSFWGMKRNAVRGMSINGGQASVRAHRAGLSPVPLR